jgi:hypothetical protein
VTTAASSNVNRISFRAVTETVIAIILALGIAMWSRSLIGIALGACIAPLMLLRSRASVATSIRWFQKGLPKPMVRDDPLLLGLRYLWILVWSVVVRVAATLRHPLMGIRSMPENWKRVVLCTSVFAEVELVPEMEPVAKTLRRVTYDEESSKWWFLLGMIVICSIVAAAAHWLRHLDDSIWLAAITWFYEGVSLLMLLVFLLGLGCFAIAFGYRIGLKSTAFLWLPFLYAVSVTLDESLSLQAKLREIRISALWRLIRLLAWATIILFGLKVIVLPQAIGWWNNQQWTTVLNVYVMPNVIHLWHVAAFLNAAIALIGYYLFLERAPRLLRDGIWSERAAGRFLQVFTFLRGLLSMYVIAVGIYLTVIAAITMHWPEWSGSLFPWQN